LKPFNAPACVPVSGARLLRRIDAARASLEKLEGNVPAPVRPVTEILDRGVMVERIAEALA